MERLIMNIMTVPKIKTEEPIATALPVPPISWDKSATREPSPQPRIVPAPRFKPLLIVAPENIINK